MLTARPPNVSYHPTALPPTATIPCASAVVESINATIKAVLRRARMRDEEMLLLKLKWATSDPIRSARGLARFLNVPPPYSNR